MRELILKNIGFALFLFVIIIIIFLFADSKIDKIYLETRVYELQNQVSELRIKLDGIRDSYRFFIVSQIRQNKLSIDVLSQNLPESEIQIIMGMIDKIEN